MKLGGRAITNGKLFDLTSMPSIKVLQTARRKTEPINVRMLWRRAKQSKPKLASRNWKRRGLRSKETGSLV